MHARSALRGVVVWSIGLTVAASLVAVESAGDRGNRDSKETALMTAVDASPVEPAPDLGELVRPLHSEAEVRRYVITAAGRTEGTVAGPTSTDGTSRLAYSNTLGKWVFGPVAGLAGVRIADDITTTAGPGCNLDRYVIMVSGDMRGDGSGVGPFGVDVGLYEMCPGASTEPVAIEGTSAHVDLPDNGTYVVVLLIPPDMDIPIPSSLYLGMSFSRDNVGVVVGAPATVGFSVDRFDYPGFPCAAGLGGFPQAEHASFYAQIYVRDECPASFPGYINTNHGGGPFSAGKSRLFADRIRLAVDECNLIGYQIAHKGNGIIQVDLRTELSISDPENGGKIPDSRAFIWSLGGDIQVHNQYFAPVDLSVYGQVWVAFKTTTSSAGPVLTCREPGVGDTANEYMTYDEVRSEWTAVQGEESCWLGFDVTLYCEGLPPIGACCDMFLTENAACLGGPNAGDSCIRRGDCRVCVGGPNDGNWCSYDGHCPEGDCPVTAECVGDSVCRELPRMNCAFPELWAEGGRCGPVCVGGRNDGEHCTVDADCTVCVEGPRHDRPCCPGGVCNAKTGQCEGGDRAEYTCCPDGACMPGGCEGSFCVGGDNDAQACSVQSDCPGGDCPGPFAHPCGVSACCKPDDTCENLTKEECYTIPPVERDRWSALGQFCGEDGQRCPINACIQLEGECTLARPAVGCWDAFCCTYVCTLDPWCCEVEWDELCVRWSRELCSHRPHNDECFDPDPERGAKLLTVPDTFEGDSIHATRSVGDPGFCCHTEDRGAQGFATVWYKFVATDTSARLSTCASVGYTVEELFYLAEDSLLAVFSVGEPDRGICTDQSVCSVAGQNCADGSECVFDEQTACETLAPIACNDDDETCDPAGPADPQPRRSTLCVTDLVPGDPYYVMVAAKTDEVNTSWPRNEYPDLGVYRLDITSPCFVVVPTPLHNDWCIDAEEWTGGDTDPLVIPFDISGDAFGEDAATFDCPGPPVLCMQTMENDVWYDWTSPCTGVVTVDTCEWFCNGGPDFGLPCDDDNDCADPGRCRTPDTGLVVYEGCECPVDIPRELECSDFQLYPCHLGSKVTFDAAEGTCYKLRLGGRLGGEPAGNMTINVTCDCAEGSATFLVPPNGVVDARQPHPPGDPSQPQGIDQMKVAAPLGCEAVTETGEPKCWSVCETNSLGTGIGIEAVTRNWADDTFTIKLNRPITPGEVTTITYTDYRGAAQRGSFISHPANVDGDGLASPNDVLVLIDILNGSPAPPWGWFSTDCDHSGSTGPADIICVVDLLNHGWLGTTLPRNPGTCP